MFTVEAVLPFITRWGSTPMDEATHFGHHDVVALLQQCQDKFCRLDAENEGSRTDLDSPP